MKRLGPIVTITSLLLATVTQANNLTATVDSLQIDPTSGGGYVRLTGLPTFDGNGCTSSWARGSLDDDKFMIYMWPALMNAKNQAKSVTIYVSGCDVGYPRITLIQLNAN